MKGETDKTFKMSQRNRGKEEKRQKTDADSKEKTKELGSPLKVESSVGDPSVD